MREDQGVVGGQGRELVRGRDEGQPRGLGDGCGDAVGELGVGIETGADRTPAEGELVEAGQRELEALDVTSRAGRRNRRIPDRASTARRP